MVDYPLPRVVHGKLVDDVQTTPWVDAIEDHETRLLRAEAPILSSAPVTAQQGGITTETDLTGMVVTFELAVASMVKLAAYGLIESAAVDDRWVMRIRDSDSLAIVQQDFGVARLAGVVSGSGHPITHSLPLQPGVYTYKATLTLAGGTGPLSFVVDNNGPGWLEAEYKGPA